MTQRCVRLNAIKLRGVWSCMKYELLQMRCETLTPGKMSTIQYRF